jgi:hypothetical protein
MNQPANDPDMKVIDVFAGTGHHYDFVPIKDELLRTYPDYKKLCLNEKMPWFKIEHEWLRARFGMREGKPGLWVVVETNVGTIKR